MRIMAILAALAVTVVMAGAALADDHDHDSNGFLKYDSFPVSHFKDLPAGQATPAENIGVHDFVCDISDGALPKWIDAATFGIFSEAPKKILVHGDLDEHRNKEMVSVIEYYSGGNHTRMHCYNSQVEVNWQSSLVTAKLAGK